MKLRILPILIFISLLSSSIKAQNHELSIQYNLLISEPESHSLHIQMQISGWNSDSVKLKMPNWMPGYYQVMNYAKNIENFSVELAGKVFPHHKTNDNTWEITNINSSEISINYDVKTDRKFVATSYVDNNHAYIVNAGVFMYIEGYLNRPVNVKVNSNPWRDIATGLDPIVGKNDEFSADNYDILYDCPILLGNLEELSPFKIKGIDHRFIGYDLGNFDRGLFIKNLEKVVEASVNTIGDIPYKQYTFIAIGKGRGGIEHLNNTTFSFNGDGLHSEVGMNTMLNFLAHEYFHHYNVKRIRPLELGPFNYDKGSKTNLLWVSEGISVYYEYLVVKRAGLKSDKMLFEDLEKNINTFENNPGRRFQSLTQASYNTWKDGPFGNQSDEKGKTISYYQKGPIVGFLLDFAIRNATKNKQSLDNVMQFLYWEYYKKMERGFTDAEFQQACETIAGTSLTSLFEYVYTTKDIEYNKYLNSGGLQLIKEKGTDQKIKFTLTQIENPSSLQREILNSWLGK